MFSFVIVTTTKNLNETHKILYVKNPSDVDDLESKMKASQENHHKQNIYSYKQALQNFR